MGTLLLAAAAPDALGFVEQHLFLWFCCSTFKSRYFPGRAFNCIFLFDYKQAAAAGLAGLEVSVLAPRSAAAVRTAGLWPLSRAEAGDRVSAL